MPTQVGIHAFPAPAQRYGWQASARHDNERRDAEAKTTDADMQSQGSLL